MSDDQERPEPTLPPNSIVQLRDWHNESEDEAREFGQFLMATTHEWSRYLDLSRLSKVILAYDYHAALALARGDDQVADVATVNEFGQSAAMSIVVREGDELKSVVVVSTPLIKAMFDEEDSTLRRSSLQSYVHELVHVDDHAFLDRTFPGGAAAATPADDLHGALLAIVMPARSEYEATRRTALIEPSTGLQFLDMLSAVLADLWTEVRRERRKYNEREISLEEFWPWLQERCRFVFQSLGYALGHADGVLNEEEASGDLKAVYLRRLEDIASTDFGWLIDATRAAVMPIYRQEAWTGLAIFVDLVEVGRRLLGEFGVQLLPQANGFWVDVPWTWDPALN
jgi:hypothetical protein